MTSTTNYPELDQLFGAYLNQDYQIWGDTLEEVLGSYKRDSSAADHVRMLDDIASFTSANAGRLDAAFSERYGRDFDPKLWGHTAASFFGLVKSVLTVGDNA